MNMEVKFLGDIIYETMEKKSMYRENKMKIKLMILPMLMICLGTLTPGLCQEGLDLVRMGTSAEAFDTLRRPAAVFDHDEHNEAAGIEDCAVCHHVWEDGKLVPDESSEDTPCAIATVLRPDRTIPYPWPMPFTPSAGPATSNGGRARCSAASAIKKKGKGGCT